MAEERNLATARAPEVGDPEATKEELQRRMEEARESITQTVSDIKETVTTQYQNVRETISQSLDWREQYRRRPVAFSVGALGVGLVVGYSVAGALMPERADLVERYYGSQGDAYDASDNGGGAQPQMLAGTAAGASAYAAAPPAAYPAAESAPAPRPSYSSGYEAQSADPPEPDKPGLIERFKETQAYDRLQEEVSKLGSRAVEELSKTAQTVVLPALLNKVKELLGLDLSGGGAQRQQASARPTGTQTAPGTQGSAGPTGGQQPGGGTPYAPTTG
ncbi:MAG TPA: hypothetical protein VF546_11820 [Pyrinomonadaceae bacterium]|jgi:ElaB/YqjD/DUF883 family membrane-anchored ribosome-binding protein